MTTELEVVDVDIVPKSTVDIVFERHRELLFRLMDDEGDTYTLVSVLRSLAKDVSPLDALLYQPR